MSLFTLAQQVITSANEVVEVMWYPVCLFVVTRIFQKIID